ncbi:MAG: hypothetical protein WCF84_05775 [Anaerolineae bacterium]
MIPEQIAITLQVIQVLDTLGVPYLIGGSLASTLHGEPRASLDVDLVADLEGKQVAPLALALSQEFYLDQDAAREAIRTQGSFNLIHYGTGFKVDIFIRKRRPFDDAQFNRRRLVVLATDPERTAFVASPEDSILAKLEWHRLGGEVSDRQWRDVLGMIRAQGARLDRDYLERMAQQMGLADLLAHAMEKAG